MEPDKTDYEINLYYLSVSETIFDDPPGHMSMNMYYRKMITSFLQRKSSLHTFKEQVMVINSVKSWAEIEEMFPLRYVEHNRMLLDLYIKYKVQKNDYFYDGFFAFTLKNTPLLHIEPLLNYHLHKYYEGDAHTFCRFLKLMLRDLGEGQRIVPVTVIKTVEEWMAEQQQASKALNGATPTDDNVRTRYDGKTSLTVQQTTLLYHFLRKAGIFREGVQTTDIAKALHILTGFSVQSLREEIGPLNPKNLSELPERLKKVATDENISKVYNKLIQLQLSINKDFPQDKKK